MGKNANCCIGAKFLPGPPLKNCPQTSNPQIGISRIKEDTLLFKKFSNLVLSHINELLLFQGDTVLSALIMVSLFSAPNNVWFGQV
jgi:hypothetical protein